MRSAVIPLGSLLLLQLLFILALSAATDCFYPNGTRSEDTVSCWAASGQATGLCCKPGDLCFDSKICARRPSEDPDDLTYYRGNCYDRRWFSSSCPKFCIESDDRAQLLSIAQCPDDSTKTRWFCGDKSLARLVNGCDDIDTAFTVSGDMVAYATAGIKPASSSTSSSAEERETPVVNLSLGHGSISTAAISQPPSTTAPGPVGTVEASGTATTSGQDVAGPPTGPPSSIPQAGDTSLAVPIGVGVGVGGTALVAASLMSFFYLRKRRHAGPARAETPPPLGDGLFAMDNRAPRLPQLFHETKLPEAQGDNEYPRRVGGTMRFELA
ncbi:hypothetical protein MFIFM68171_09941 [Madurella fahalii]|uniref:Uncharacterized protein n=1 Tax=Madurella fahalii TaxID=1157608 RepID=A0ABQ0GPR0_9PEZI